MMTRILPFLFLIIAVGIFAAYINPTWQGDVAAAQAQIKSYQSALDASKKFSAKEAELAQAQAAIPADQLARLEAFLPDGVNNVQLILDLNALAARSGVTLSNFSISDASSGTGSGSGSGQALALTASSPVQSLTISVEALGTYSAFRTFLHGIEQSLRPLDVVNVSVINSNNGIYTYSITMRIYWLH